MKTILLFGAGKSATVLIDYLAVQVKEGKLSLIVADADLKLASSKIKGKKNTSAVSFDIRHAEERQGAIRAADIVISLLPPHLHILVAKDCLELKKNLLTASYIDEEIKKLKADIEKSGLIFLYEMGLDPGIDHMSAMKIFEGIRQQGGLITSFRSHCGGLVAPESDDNPWHYKISWNARNIVLAGKSGAHFLERGKEKKLSYEELFNPDLLVEVPGHGILSWYPNRDSLAYKDLYHLHDAHTILRTTLRHPDFVYGWKNIVDLRLTDEEPQYESDEKTLFELFKEHMDKNGFGEWLEKKLSERLDETKKMLENLVQLMEAEEAAADSGEKIEENFMAADEKGNLKDLNVGDIKNNAAGYMAYRMHEANLTLKQLFYLGLDDKKTKVDKGFCSPADLLQFAMEKKLALQAGDRDMIIMLHEVEYKIPNHKSQFSNKITSTLIVKGDDPVHTAMAKTVGLPLGIAARLILEEKIQSKGLHIPVMEEMYRPVMDELKKNNIQFTEVTVT